MQDYTKYDDLELLALLKEKSPLSDNAFYVIYHRYTSKVYAYCIFKSDSKEEAEEILQDAWIRFYNSINSGKKVDNILPFLLTIVRNICIDRFRAKNSNKRKNIEYFNIDTIERFADPFQFQSQIEKEELTTLLKIAVENLEAPYKETVALYWFGNMSYEQIAEICGEAVPCIRMRFSRAVKQLVALLKPYIIELSD